MTARPRGGRIGRTDAKTVTQQSARPGTRDGAVVGGLLISLVSGDGLALRPSGIIGSIVGAVLLLAAWQAIRGRSRGRST